MRVAGSWSLLVAASFTSSLALAEPAATSVAPAAPAPAPEPAPPPPEPTPEPAPTAPGDSAASATDTPVAPPSDTHATPSDTPSPAQVRAEAKPPVGTTRAPSEGEPPTDFTRDFNALPLSLEARLGFNARLGSSFDDATEEQNWGASYAVAAYLAWKPEFALGLEFDHVGLGSVRALTGQTSTDNQYNASGAWIGARVFPIRRERLDFFVNLRVGMVWQHASALGTRNQGMSITEPAQSYSCTESDGPGIGLGAGLGVAYRLGRHVAFVSRLDLSGMRSSGEYLGTCTDGIGSVANLSGSVGLAFEFETAPK